MSSVKVDRKAGTVEILDGAGVVNQHCARYLERLRVRGLSIHTVESYAYDLALAHRWMASNGLTIESLSADDAHRFIAWERGRESHPRSINRRLHTLRLFYQFVTGKPLAGAFEHSRRFRPFQRDRELGIQRVLSPPKRQLRVKEPMTLVEPLDLEAVQKLLAHLDRYRDLCIAHFMLLCGLRTQEVILLRPEDVNFEDRRVRVFGKGGKERVVPLPTVLIEMVRRYVAFERPADCSSGRLFVVLQGPRRGQPMTRAALRRVFRTRRQRPGLHKANPHRLRHTFGTDMARSGVRLPILQRMMGHAFLETTVQYVSLSMSDVAAEFRRAMGTIERRYALPRGER
jgi:site-specific recombinase XerD